MDGSASRKVWVIDIAMMNTEIVIGEINVRRKGDAEKANTAIKFICRPGVKPVIIPVRHPISIAINISRIIFNCYLIGYYF